MSFRGQIQRRGISRTGTPGSDPTGARGTYRKRWAVCRNDLGGATTVFVENVREECLEK